jgi:hypothetical protein
MALGLGILGILGMLGIPQSATGIEAVTCLELFFYEETLTRTEIIVIIL